MPAILRFLSYDPYPVPTTLAERLFMLRRQMGWSLKAAAKQIDVDEGTWAKWELGKPVLYGKHRVRVARMLRQYGKRAKIEDSSGGD